MLRLSSRGEDSSADLARVGAEARHELFDSSIVLLVGSGDEQDVVDKAGKEVGTRIAAQLDRGNDNHVEAFGLVERLSDIRFTDRPVAPAVRRNKRRQIEVGFPIAGDHIGQRSTPGGDIDEPGLG